MPFFPTTVESPPKPFFTLAALISFLLILSHGFITATKAQNYTYGGDPSGTCAEMKMKIGIPVMAQFQEFVKVNPNETLDEKKYDGFCIDLFREVLKIFLENNYTLPYEFVPYHGTYTELVEGVSNGIFDAAVGDITIQADRSKHVEFTHPYMESRLVMIAPAKYQHKAWQFLKPFTVHLWMATFGILIYTMLIVWFFEYHAYNTEIDQINEAGWFIFTSLFFSHSEKVKSNFTRVVVVVWLFVVLIITTNYTANLTSMLTVSHLEPKKASIEWLKKSNSKVSCNGDSFVMNYLEEVLGFTRDNIKTVGNEYIEEFESGSIAAAFLELPYGKYFISQHSEGYVMTEPKYRKQFGGFGFVFKKSSPIVNNVSEAILTLFENGRLNMLESKWFGGSLDYSEETTKKVESLSLHSFWGLYLITGVTSTVLFLIRFGMNRCKISRKKRNENEMNRCNCQCSRPPATR